MTNYSLYFVFWWCFINYIDLKYVIVAKHQLSPFSWFSESPTTFIKCRQPTMTLHLLKVCTCQIWKTIVAKPFFIWMCHFFSFGCHNTLFIQNTMTVYYWVIQMYNNTWSYITYPHCNVSFIYLIIAMTQRRCCSLPTMHYFQWDILYRWWMVIQVVRDKAYLKPLFSAS